MWNYLVWRNVGGLYYPDTVNALTVLQVLLLSKVFDSEQENPWLFEDIMFEKAVDAPEVNQPLTFSEPDSPDYRTEPVECNPKAQEALGSCVVSKLRPSNQ